MEDRRFFVTSLSAGFALAVQPITAQTTIHTPADDLEAGEVKVPVSDGTLPAYRAYPAQGDNFPIVLVVQEIFGVHEHIRDLCRRLAHKGYFAIAPELYARQGDVSHLSTIQEIMPIVSKVPDSEVMSDLDATVDYAASTKHADPARVALTGFCWGGRVAWLYSAHSNRLKAAAAWYGRLIGATDELHPKNPIDLVSGLKAPVLGLYGGKDQGIPLDTVEKMRAALIAAKNPSQLTIYPEAGHGFNADYRPSYDPQAATAAWNKMLAWFKQHGVS